MGLGVFFVFIILVAVAIMSFLKNKIGLSLLFILLTGLVLRLFVASSPILNDWDEKYHALVAKNFIANPVKPVLYANPVLNYDPNEWTGNHIWLSKPPVPLWLIAASIKCFGTNAYAVRLPSVLLSLLAIYLTFLLGKKLFNERVGIIAAFLYSINGLLIELVGGKVSSDHVEVTFIVLFQLAVFTAVRFIINKEIKWWKYLLLGALVGLVFLSKWQVSLLFFVVWFGAVLFSKQIKFIEIIKYTLIIGVGFLLVSGLWLWHICDSFPNETKAIYKGLTSPMNKVIQNHAAPWYYYLHKLMVLFGEVVYVPFFVLVFLFYKDRDWKKVMLLLWVIVPVLIFSLAATKRFTYLVIISPAVFIMISHFLVAVINEFRVKKWLKILTVVLLLCLPIRYTIERCKFFRNQQVEISEYNQWKQELKEFVQAHKNERIILFNESRHIEAMFYHDLIAYPGGVDNDKIVELENLGYNCYFEIK